ncbi:MAG TPA: excinuclease ABC subunit UvrA, partial [Pirellulaceae bacterium]|nr:excinuclease ABC subunit UvrA [Pirellulaceae bacterium]
MHNLRNVDLDLPRDRFVVLTGPSGSGKSSLAFDTLFAEGQRQYLETLSVYARQFLHQMERPEVEAIEGLPPTICIDQRPGARNPRSTVATVTEIYDHLRLLFARLGEAACYECGAPIRQQDPDEIHQRLLRLGDGAKLMLLAPMVRGKKGEQQLVFGQIRKAGFVRVRIDGQLHDVEQLPELSPRKQHTIDAVVDRIVVRDGIEQRLAESLRLALRHGDGLVAACYLRPGAGAGNAGASGAGTNVGGEGWHEELFSTRHACPNCDINYEELEPRTFSFNSPYGACPVCEGLGVRVEFDPDLVIPDHTQSLEGGAIAPWRGVKSASARRGFDELCEFATSDKIPLDKPLDQIKPASLQRLLQGDGQDFPGLILLLERELATETDVARQETLAEYRGPVACTACGGSRLRPEASSVRVAGMRIHDLTRMSVEESRSWFRQLKFNGDDRLIGEPIVNEILHRLEFLSRVGVDYLTLDRPADTLSGGELQRVRLATSIGSGLAGVCYVLDEPSIGLHQRDNQRLIDALRDLQQRGSTVIVVEHDEAMMRQADWLVDIGPGAGRLGGEVVAQGRPDELIQQASSLTAHSLTARYLAGVEQIAPPRERRRVAKTRVITLEGARSNNLRDLTVHFPLGVLTCVTGVSGSGKSSLVNETLAPALLRRLGLPAGKPGPYTSLRGASQIDKVIQIDQAPLGRTPRSNPATYCGTFDELRKVFATTREAKQRGYRVGRFSFNAKGGRCETCQGQGVQRIEMNFLPDIYVACADCGGKRFNAATLEVKYRGKSIADVLDMSVDEAADFFVNFSAITRTLQSLQEVGLGHLQLGRPSTTLSGGEAQRVKLANELSRTDTGRTLYLLDEPTTGLHFDDIKKLLVVLNRLVDKGNTVLVIEHNLDVIKCADWLIDLGPEGGGGGGRLLACGPPEEVASLADNSTGKFL